MAYTAIILSQHDRIELQSRTRAFVPEGWQTFCHHLTLNMGKMDGELNDLSLLGADCNIEVDAIGMTDKAIAVRASVVQTDSRIQLNTENKIPHITVAVNTKNGGKPKMSKDIKIWGPFSMTLNGKILTTGA